MTVDNYILQYFDGRGRGEAIRMLFAHVNAEYKDERIKQADWPTYKPQMPFGQCPLLIVNGHKIAQTTAILRYLGNKYDLVGKTPLDNAMIDMLGESIQDFFPNIRPWVMVRVGMVPGDAAEVYKEKVAPHLDTTLPIFEKYLEDSGTGWFVGEHMTWVDIFAGEFFSKFTAFGDATALDKYPKLKQLVERVHDQPNIKKYIEQRPESIF